MTRLGHVRGHLVATPLAWRIFIATALAVAVMVMVQLPKIRPAAYQQPNIHNSLETAPSAVGLPPLPDGRPALPLAAAAARLSNAAVPIAEISPAAAPFHFTGTPADRARARDCLALAAWYEAGDDPPGERAVIQVVLNRARHPAFPAGICAVVFQGADRTTGCQFTFTCDGSLARVPAPIALIRARAIAEAALSGAVDANVGLATHYHADYVVPRWRDGLVKLAREGAHLFYRWPGHWGSAKAMATRPGSGVEAPQPALAALSPAHHGQADDLAATVADVTAPTPAIAATLPSDPAPAGPRPLEMQLDPAAPPGRYALDALALCRGTDECRVAGRLAHDVAFAYIRSSKGHGEGAYWDCTRFQRTDRAQCLPGGLALERLLAAS